MDFSFDIFIKTIFYVGAVQGFILTVFLFSVKSNRISNRLLGILTSIWGIILLVFALQSYGLFAHYPHLLKTFSHLMLTWFPLLFLSVKYLISDHQKFVKRDLLHFVPLLLNILMYSRFYFWTGEEKLIAIRADEGYYYISNIITQELLSIQGIVYTIASLLILNKYSREVVNYQSNIDIKVIRGFKVGVILSLVAWSIGIIASHLEMFNFNIGVDLFIFVYLTVVIIIYVLSILAIRSPEVYKLTEEEVEGIGSTGVLMDKNAQNRIQQASGFVEIETGEYDEQIIEINDQLSAVMQTEKPYLNPDLSLQELANLLNVSRHQLSAVLNQMRHKNFYEFVNTYRVEEVKMLMTDAANKDEKVINLAYDAGFNSHASFYRIFKQITNETPTKYRSTVSVN